jgi:hypothetical protein
MRVKDNSGLYPNSENLIPVLTHYFQSIESVLLLTLNGVYWARNEHYSLFTNILKAISEPPRSVSGSIYKPTRDLLYFPSLLIIYAIGLSALKRDNYEIINECFNMKVRESDSDYSEEVFLIEKVHSCIVERDVMNSILGRRSKVPLSSYLYEALEPIFLRYFYNAKDFQAKFDLFEYLLSLNYYHLVGEKMGYNWAPWGDYQWRRLGVLRGGNYVLDNFNKESDKEKDSWKPLRSGMFNGNYLDYVGIRTKLEAFLKEVHLY